MKTVAVSEETWRKLKELKERMGLQSFNKLIEVLIETWHLKSLREELSKVDLDLDYEDARAFLETTRYMYRRGSVKSRIG